MAVMFNGGLLKESLIVVYGNPDAMIAILSFTIIVSLGLVSIEVYKKSKL